MSFMGQPYNPYDPPQAYGLPDGEAADDPLATRGQRFGGALLDGLFSVVLGLIPAFVLHVAGFDPFPSPPANVLGWMPSPLLILCANLLPDGIQWWLITQSGQTVGKKLLGTRIVTVEGEVAGLVHGVLLRSAPLFALSAIDSIVAEFAPGPVLLKSATSAVISLVTFVDPLFIFGSNKRCLHDYIAGTRVVRAGTRPTSESAAP